MHLYSYNLEKKLSFIKKNPKDFYKNPAHYLKDLINDIKHLDVSLAYEIEHLEVDKLTVEYVEKLLVRIMQILSGEEQNSNIELDKILLNELDYIGPKTSKYLADFGLTSVYDLLTHFPIRYEYLDDSLNAKAGVLHGTLINYEIVYTRGRKKLLQAFLKGHTNNYFYAVWMYFNKHYPISLLKRDNYYYFYGDIQNFNGKLAIFHPEFINKEDLGVIRPVYVLPKNVKRKVFVNIVNNALVTYKSSIKETLNVNLLNKYNFPPIYEAIQIIHFPTDKNAFNFFAEQVSSSNKEIYL